MEYFDEKGHLTDFALKKLVEGEENELKRLEITEHLSFCDRCLDNYIKKMPETELMSVPESMEKSIFYVLKKRVRKVFYSNYASMAVAASLSMVLWVGGVFEMSIEHFKTFNDHVKIERGFSEKLSNKFSEELEKIMEEICYGKQK